MKGTQELDTIRSAAVLADWADTIPLSEIEKVTFEARENAFYAGCLAEWWDEFWHGFALTVARENRRMIWWLKKVSELHLKF